MKMAYRIAQPGERLRLDLKELTKEDGSGFVIYSRLLAGKRKDLVKKHGGGRGADINAWPVDAQEKFLDDTLRACFLGTEGTLDAEGNERSMTVEEALEQPEDFKAFLFNAIVRSSTRGAEALGNSVAT